MILHATETGSGGPLVILHGMLGRARNWHGVSRMLAPRFRVVALDLRGHGDSPSPEPLDYPAMAADVAETMDSLGLGRAALIGHSMGGKVAMQLALSQGARVSALVVVDIAPVAYAEGNLDLIRAMRSVDLASARRRADVDRALEPSVPDGTVRAFLLQGLVSLPGGGLGWRVDLELLERSAPLLSRFPETTVRFGGPTLFVTGGRSSYVLPEHHGAIRALFPAAQIATIPEAGHWVHADRTEAFVELATEFLDG